MNQTMNLLLKFDYQCTFMYCLFRPQTKGYALANSYMTIYEKTENKKVNQFPLAPMGVLAPGSAQTRPSARPLSTLAEFFLEGEVKLAESFSD